MLVNRWIKETGGALLHYSPELEMRENLQSAFRKLVPDMELHTRLQTRKRTASIDEFGWKSQGIHPMLSGTCRSADHEGYFAPLGIISALARD